MKDKNYLEILDFFFVMPVCPSFSFSFVMEENVYGDRIFKHFSAIYCMMSSPVYIIRLHCMHVLCASITVT